VEDAKIAFRHGQTKSLLALDEDYALYEASDFRIVQFGNMVCFVRVRKVHSSSNALPATIMLRE
jgi:hypothetical protein